MAKNEDKKGLMGRVQELPSPVISECIFYLHESNIDLY